MRNIPRVSGRSISDNVENFFRKNHRDHYLCHQVSGALVDVFYFDIFIS